MFGIGSSELVVIFIVALLVFGADKLPELAKTLGKLSGEVKKNHDMLRREFYNAVYAPIPEGEEDKKKQLVASKSNDEEKKSTEASQTSAQSEIIPDDHGAKEDL